MGRAPTFLQQKARSVAGEGRGVDVQLIVNRKRGTVRSDGACKIGAALAPRLEKG